MTMSEAREVYLKADCSHFVMCTCNYSSYMQYMRLAPTKRQEEVWQNEKMQILYKQLQRSGNYEFFEKLYKIAVEFRNDEKLKFVLETLNNIRIPMNPVERIRVAELILGIGLKYRDGLVCWAQDLGYREEAILLMEQAKQYLDIQNIRNVSLEKRRQHGKWMYQKISLEFKEAKILA